MLDACLNLRDNGSGSPHKGHKRVLRGGSWINNGRNLRSAYRNANPPDKRNNNIGLRLAGALLPSASMFSAGMPSAQMPGSVNQRCNRFHWYQTDGQNPGPRCVSRQAAAALAESLPLGRLIRTVWGAGIV